MEKLNLGDLINRRFFGGFYPRGFFGEIFFPGDFILHAIFSGGFYPSRNFLREILSSGDCLGRFYPPGDFSGHGFKQSLPIKH